MYNVDLLFLLSILIYATRIYVQTKVMP